MTAVPIKTLLQYTILHMYLVVKYSVRTLCTSVEYVGYTVYLRDIYNYTRIKYSEIINETNSYQLVESWIYLKLNLNVTNGF